MKRLWLIGGIITGLATLPVIQCFGGGDEVIVIYNSRVPESKEVADYYAQRRNVPTNQIFGFSLPTGLDMSRAEFRDDLQLPLAHELEARNLWHIRSQINPAANDQPGHIEWCVRETKIRYAVLCYGVPVRVLRDNSLKETGQGNVRPEFQRNEACVENELALLPLYENNPLLTGPAVNHFYGATNSESFNPTNGILMVTRLDGPSAAIAKGLVDKAIQAETDGMWGRAYFDLRNVDNVGLKLGDEWIGNAAQICRRLGFETVVDTNSWTFPASFPMSQIAIYCGWYDEHASGPFTLPVVEFMPGAFAYHLHSFSAGDIRSTTNRWVGPFLAKGVTITMGSVDEPYLTGTPNVGLFCSDLIYGRYSFGEAAYASQMWVSWQTTVIGDPLYRPFAKSPEQLHAELGLKQSKLIEWSFLRLINLNQAAGRPLAGVVSLAEQVPVLDQSAVLTEKLADLYVEQGKPSSAIETYQRALTLTPSPEQRIRIRLTLGEKLIAAQRKDEAIEDYEKLLAEFPDYPGKDLVTHQLAALKPQPAGTNTVAKP
ncbi:MAG TPA: TIGR03790 family protein [Verrucomicrobiae bacterium]|jgi:uncharacterized protein (TIGR03790 family)|nr:TIGR03790 family protein [Verrucomicrobiae bacterium]